MLLMLLKVLFRTGILDATVWFKQTFRSNQSLLRSKVSSFVKYMKTAYVTYRTLHFFQPYGKINFQYDVLSEIYQLALPIRKVLVQVIFT